MCPADPSSPGLGGLEHIPDPTDLPLSFSPHSTGSKGIMSQVGFSGKQMPRCRLVCTGFLRESSRGHHLCKSKEGSQIGQRRNRAVMQSQWHQPAHGESGVALQSCLESRQEDPSLYTALHLPVIELKVPYRGGIAWER